MAFFEYDEYSFFSTDISGILGGRRSFEAWLVNDWFKVDLLGDVKGFLPALRQYNLNRFFLAQI